MKKKNSCLPLITYTTTIVPAYYFTAIFLEIYWEKFSQYISRVFFLKVHLKSNRSNKTRRVFNFLNLQKYVNTYVKHWKFREDDNHMHIWWRILLLMVVLYLTACMSSTCMVLIFFGSSNLILSNTWTWLYKIIILMHAHLEREERELR